MSASRNVNAAEAATGAGRHSRNMISGIVGALLSAAVMAASYPLYLRYLGYSRYGLWLVLTSIINLTQLGNLGLSQVLTMRLAAAWTAGDRRGMRAALTNTFVLLTAAAVVIAASLLATANPVVGALHLSADSSDVARGLFPSVVILSVYSFFVDASLASLSGIGRMDLANTGQVVNQALAAVVSIYLLHKGYGLTALLSATAASYAIVHAAAIAVFWRMTAISPFRPARVTLESLRDLSSAGSQLMAGSVLAILVNPLSKLLLSRYGGLALVPVYDIAFNAAMRLRSVFELAQRALVPEIIRLRCLSAGSSSDVSALYNRSIRLVLWCVPLYAIGWIFAPPALQLWLGSRYQPAIASALRVMLCGTYFSLLGTPAFYTLMALRRLGAIVLSNFIQFCLSVGIVTALASSGMPIGPNIVVWATAAGMLASTLYLLIQQHRADLTASEGVPAVC